MRVDFLILEGKAEGILDNGEFILKGKRLKVECGTSGDDGWKDGV